MPGALKQKRHDLLQYRIARIKRRLVDLRKIERRFPWYRLSALVAGLIAAYLGFSFLPQGLAWIVSGLALIGFMLLAVRHRQVIDHIGRLETFCHLLSTHLARLDLDWDRIPAPAEIPVHPDHPFASDLNITAQRSLHQLIDTTISQGGSQRLADWLLCTLPNPEQTAQRQGLVHELLSLPAFREQLELAGLLKHPEHTPRWDTSGLLRWLAKPDTGESQVDKSGRKNSLLPMLMVQACLAVINITLFLLNARGILPPLWIATFLLYLALQALRFTQTSAVFEESYSLARMLGQIFPILIRLEKYPYPPDSRIEEHAEPITHEMGLRPSVAQSRLSWIISASSLRGNPLISLLLNFLMPWDLFLAYQLERYRESLRIDLPLWLENWYEIEALCALANFAAFNPEYTFPEIAEPGTQPILDGHSIGHPLIPDAMRVTNDFTLQQMGEVVIITGSNMSGKSTFLRTMGVNLVLAYAGSPVAAEAMRVLPFRIFTSMNLADSLSDGISYFYAEVRRLKNLLDALDGKHASPLFFLIDEIFRGTNNRERQIGSQSYSQALAGKYGTGCISTHDLELAHLADSNAWIKNYHFREDIQDAQMVFDFKIRPGASPTTNALRIMALAGLPVPQTNLQS